MVIWKTIATGSKGNCYLLQNGDRKILIEAGISMPEIKKALAFDFSGLEACLVTHEHGDHACSAKHLARAGVDIYASAGTFSRLEIVNKRRCKVLSHGCKPAIVAGFSIIPFNTEHDAEEPLGFQIEHIESGQKILFATDTYTLRWIFHDINFWFLECNYKIDILEENIRINQLPEIMKKVKWNHWSLQNVKQYIQSCISNTDPNFRALRLIHPSAGNLDIDEAESEIKEILPGDVKFTHPDEEIIINF